MTPAQWKRVKQVAGDAWALPPADRESYARQRCGSDAALQTDVLELLRSMAKASDAFDRPLYRSKPTRRSKSAKRGSDRSES